MVTSWFCILAGDIAPVSHHSVCLSVCLSVWLAGWLAGWLLQAGTGKSYIIAACKLLTIPAWKVLTAFLLLVLPAAVKGLRKVCAARSCKNLTEKFG